MGLFPHHRHGCRRPRLLIVAFCLVERRAAEPLIPLGLFRIGVFNVSSAVGFIVGFIMFGAIIFIPLYLQTVHGATPTSAGLQLLPMVGGMLITFILSGRLISRWGRYKVFPIFGTGVTAIGLYLLSLLHPDDVVGRVVGLHVRRGLRSRRRHAGPGRRRPERRPLQPIGDGDLVGHVLPIDRRRDRHRPLRSHLRQPPARRTAQYLPASALKHCPAAISINPAQIGALPPACDWPFEAFSHAIHSVFLIGAPFAALAFALTWLLHEVPLRNQAFVSTETESVSL